MFWWSHYSNTAVSISSWSSSCKCSGEATTGIKLWAYRAGDLHLNVLVLVWVWILPDVVYCLPSLYPWLMGGRALSEITHTKWQAANKCKHNFFIFFQTIYMAVSGTHLNSYIMGSNLTSALLFWTSKLYIMSSNLTSALLCWTSKLYIMGSNLTSALLCWTSEQFLIK